MGSLREPIMKGCTLSFSFKGVAPGLVQMDTALYTDTSSEVV